MAETLKWHFLNKGLSGAPRVIGIRTRQHWFDGNGEHLHSWAFVELTVSLSSFLLCGVIHLGTGRSLQVHGMVKGTPG